MSAPRRFLRYLVAADSCFQDLPGGFQRVAWDIATVMRDRGHAVAMVCFDERNAVDVPASTVHEGIEVHRCARPRLPAWSPRRMGAAIAALSETVTRTLARDRWDVVHVHSHVAGAGAVRALGPSPPYVFTLHSPIVAENRINWRHQGVPGRLKLLLGVPLLRRLERALLRGATGIHALSAFTRDEVQREHGIGDRVEVIPHWRRDDFRRLHDRADARRRLGWPEREKILFTVRRLGPRYGIDLAVEAIAPLAAERRCVFYVAGDGELREHLERRIEESGTGGRVRLLGRVSEDVLRLAYEASDLFVLPTLSLECFGLITLEALSFGCPVVCTDVAAIPEMVRPLLPEFVVPAGDVPALRAKISAFLDGRLVPASPDAIERHLEARYGREVVVPKLLSLIENAAG